MEQDQKDDLLLFDRMQNGCRDSFELLYNRYASRLYAYGNRISGDSLLVEDVIHDVFLKLWSKRKNILIRISFRHYLFKVFKTDLVGKLARESKNSSLNSQNSQGLWEKSFMDILAESQIELSSASKVRAAINSLPEKQREVIFLRFIENMSTSQIANLLQIKTETVHNHYSKAFKNLMIFFRQNVESVILALSALWY